MHIFVNDSVDQTFVFSDTGVWCNQGGTSSSIMLPDLSGLKVGLNTFTFQNPSGTPSPLLEWIKFVESCYSYSENPSEAPSILPSVKTMIPSNYPTEVPTGVPSIVPSLLPSSKMSSNPTHSSSLPSLLPSTLPSDIPSELPSLRKSDMPTISPTTTILPTNAPSFFPSSTPSESFAPSFSPTTELFGTTCIDDESHEFTLSNGNTADCSWFLHYNPLIARLRCSPCRTRCCRGRCCW